MNNASRLFRPKYVFNLRKKSTENRIVKILENSTSIRRHRIEQTYALDDLCYAKICRPSDSLYLEAETQAISFTMELMKAARKSDLYKVLQLEDKVYPDKISLHCLMFNSRCHWTFFSSTSPMTLMYEIIFILWYAIVALLL